MKGKIGIFKMKHFFAGIGEIHFLSFLLYLSMSTSPIIGLVDMLRYRRQERDCQSTNLWF